jgi:uncharacterized protein (TIGR00251 family)
MIVREGVLHVSVRVKPRSSRSRLLGVREGRLEVALAVAPVDGRANRELIEVLSRCLHIRRADVALVSGERSRTKRVALRGLEPAALTAMLHGAPGPEPK